MMNIKRIILLTLLFVLAIGISAFAASDKPELLIFEDFEGASISGNYVVTAGGKKFFASNTTAQISSSAEMGQSLKIQGNGGYSALKCNFNENSLATVTGGSLAFGFSAYFEEAENMGNLLFNTSAQNIIMARRRETYLGTGTYIARSILKTGEWHDFYIEYNMNNGWINLTVTNQTTTQTFTVQGNNGQRTSLDMVEFVVRNELDAVTHIDNFWMAKLSSDISSDGLSYTGAAGTHFGYTDPGKKEYKYKFTGAIDDIDLMSDATFNGDKSNIKSVTASGDELTVTLKNPLEGSEKYIFELKNVLLADGSVYSGSFFYITKPICKIDNIVNTPSVVNGSPFSCSADISSESTAIDSAVMLLVLYDKTTNAISSIDFGTVTVDNTNSPVNMSASVNVPSDGSYKAIVYIWDSIYDMCSLCEPIIIE